MSCLSVLLLVVTAAAASGGSWTGTLRDSNGNPVVKAKLQLSPTGGNPTSEVTTSDRGKFTFSGVSAGNYVISVENNHKVWKTTNPLALQAGVALTGGTGPNHGTFGT
jgi:hypothetical protein